MQHTEYVRILDADVRYRVAFDLELGKVKQFVVQLEVAVNDPWRPLIRFDTAHGFTHCDRYDHQGTAQRHEPMPASDFNEALTSATRIIREEWELLVSAFWEKN